MALFQTSVLKSHLAQLDEPALKKACKKYQNYFWNSTIQENIKTAKEAVIIPDEKEERHETTPYDVINLLIKKEEFEWMELFEENKKKAKELQTQITATEKEIDQIVYELYGLAEEEIEVVEKS